MGVRPIPGCQGVEMEDIERNQVRWCPGSPKSRRYQSDHRDDGESNQSDAQGKFCGDKASLDGQAR